MVDYFGLTILSIVAIATFVFYNILQKYRNNIKEERSNLKDYLQERWNLVPILIEIVKKYSIYDNSTIEKLSSILNENYNSLSLNKKIEIDENISKVISKMIDIGNNFENLNNDESYINFKKHFEIIEKEIKEVKKNYKEYSKKYNSKIQKFPINLVAILFGFNEELEM